MNHGGTMEENIKRDIAMDSQLGFWEIRIFPDGSRIMFGDEVMYRVLGVKENLPPDRLYQFWHKRIHPDYVRYVRSSSSKMVLAQQTEVEYPWNHPDFGWILVRCGGNLDRKENGSIYIRGYHHNITSILKNDFDSVFAHEVLDVYKFSKYAPYLLGAYDEIFEIEPDTYDIRTIAYKKEKYSHITEKYTTWDALEHRVHKDDSEALIQLFSEESISQLKENTSKSVEFRTKTLDNEFIWVRGIVFWLSFNGQDKLLFVTQDIQAKKKIDLLTKDNEDIIQALVSAKSAIIDINIDTQETRILKCDKEEDINHVSTLDALKNNFIEGYLNHDNAIILRDFLTIDTLKKCLNDKKERGIDIKFKASNFHYEWIRFSILVPPNSSNRVFLLIKNINHQYLLQHIVENFIYNSCDYLYYIDLKNDWFIRFSGNTNRKNLPPEKGSNYEQCVRAFAEQYVPREDLDRVIKMMKPEYILNELDKHGFLNFTTGFYDNGTDYARKHIQIQYYDKQNQIVLMQSVDITDSYLAQKEMDLELEKVKKEAKMDFLTQLYNRLGCEEMIQTYIKECKVDKPSAFILFDLDNFKLINDHFGHQEGDEVLKLIAQRLKNSCRSNDIVARLGGDEFIVFLKELNSKEDIHHFIKPVLEKLNLDYCNNDRRIHVSASAGVTFFEKSEDSDFSTLYREADKAMYHAKNTGKNNYQIFLN